MKKLLCIALAVCAMFCTACTKDKNKVNTKPPADNVQTSENVDITLYFPDRQGLSLIAEKRSVADDEQIITAVLNELLKGPESDELMAAVPKGTKLNSANVKDGICTVDLSGEFISGAYGTASDNLSVYSIVNSVTALDDIKQVRFLIDGKEVEIFGDSIFNEPFEADSTLIKQ